MTAQARLTGPSAGARLLFFLSRAGGSAQIAKAELAGVLGLHENTVRTTLKRHIRRGNIVAYSRVDDHGASLPSVYVLTDAGREAVDGYMGLLLAGSADPSAYAAAIGSVGGCR